MWELNPTLCHNVTVRNITIDSHGPNNDGCDPDACRDVLIEKCTFSTGDDCIAIKSGRNRDGRRVGVPCENVIVQDCVMKDGHGGVSIGSEVSGGIKNMYIRRCEMSSPHLQRALRIKTNSYRGGEIENIYFMNVKVGQVAESVIEVDFYYEEGEGGPFKPVVKNVFVSNVTCQKSKYGMYLRGYANAPITGVHIAHCTFNNAEKGNFFQHVAAVSVDDVTVNGKRITVGRSQAKDELSRSTYSMDKPVLLSKYSIGVGDRFAQEAKAQLRACMMAADKGVDVIPVWNKSNREHLIIGSEPSATRSAADEAVRALGWKKPYHLDADHIGLKTVERFISPAISLRSMWRT